MSLVRRKYYRIGKHAGELVLGFCAALIESGVRAIAGIAGCGRGMSAGSSRSRRVDRPREVRLKEKRQTERSSLACRALQSLGFSKQEARRRVASVMGSTGREPALEEIIRSALSGTLRGQ